MIESVREGRVLRGDILRKFSSCSMRWERNVDYSVRVLSDGRCWNILNHSLVMIGRGQLNHASLLLSLENGSTYKSRHLVRDSDKLTVIHFTAIRHI